MDAGAVADWATAGVAGLALVVAVVAATASWKSLRWEQETAESARRSAEAAERANLLTERVLSGGPRTQLPSAEAEVEWALEHPAGHRYVLRNTGDAIAEHVRVDESQIGAIARGLPTDAVIRPGEGVDLMMVGTFGNPMPNQVYVEWGNPSRPFRAAIPVPP
ncbi:hypothetical protein [Nocardia salmonicida]|uniref:hypothetical protein n=1 Tax=Nocardia salmonicida TaxID=53431 RepID=UPI0037BAD0C6